MTKFTYLAYENGQFIQCYFRLEWSAKVNFRELLR